MQAFRIARADCYLTTLLNQTFCDSLANTARRPSHHSNLAMQAEIHPPPRISNDVWVVPDHLSAGELRQATGGKQAMDLGIKGRRAIVTGGGSGIGFETARQFLEEGVRVLIAGRTADKIIKARDELEIGRAHVCTPVTL